MAGVKWPKYSIHNQKQQSLCSLEEDKTGDTELVCDMPHQCHTERFEKSGRCLFFLGWTISFWNSTQEEKENEVWILLSFTSANQSSIENEKEEHPLK